MTDIKKHIESKINDINQMLSELDIDETPDIGVKTQGTDPKIDISKLDVVDVLHNILN